MYIAVQSDRQNSILLAKSEFKMDQINAYANNLHIISGVFALINYFFFLWINDMQSVGHYLHVTMSSV